MSDDPLDHLTDSLDAAQRAVDAAEDGSRIESVAENAVAWVGKAVDVTARRKADEED